MKKFTGFEHGMGIGGWLTNYKRFNVLPMDRRLCLTVGDYEHFAAYITEADVAYIASLGMDHIRLGFDQIVLEESPYVYREETFGHIDRFLSWCEKYGLNVVLNLHKAIGNYCDIAEAVTLLDSEELQQRFIALWKEFERRYADRPAVAFELLNEVRDVNPDQWNDLAEKTIRELRKLNPNRLLIVGSTAWNSADTLKYLRVYDDENVVYTFHTYTPFEFTHQQGVLQSAPLYYNRRMTYPDDIEKYRDYQKVVHGNENAYAKYAEMGKEFMRDVISILKENDIPYCVWNYLSTPNDGNRFSLVDDDNRKILTDKLARIIRGDVE